MASKQLEVMKWLKESLGECEVPPFERNESNINKLHQLMTASKEATQDVAKVEDYSRSKAQTYEDQSNLLKDQLKELDFSLHFLTDEEQKCVDSLASLHHDLDLHSCSASNIMLAIHSLEEENGKTESALSRERLFAANLLQLSKRVAHNLDQLNTISAEAEKEERSQKEELVKEGKKAHFFEQKIAKYQQDLKEHQAKLSHAGFEDDVSLRSVAAKMDAISKQEKELEKKKAKLSSYSLPPDLTLAEVKVEEMRQLLAHTMKTIMHSYVQQK